MTTDKGCKGNMQNFIDRQIPLSSNFLFKMLIIMQLKLNGKFQTAVQK